MEEQELCVKDTILITNMNLQLFPFHSSAKCERVFNDSKKCSPCLLK